MRLYLDSARCETLCDALAAALAEAPLFVPRMPRTGKPMSVRMANLGPLGWVTDKEGGYRYQPHHPETGRPWPAMPDVLLDAWHDLTDETRAPQACLVNLYEGRARMGLHQDRDEEDLTAPVVSLSLGATARFRVGGLKRRDPTRSFELAHGDAVVLEGPSRLAYHGIDRIVPDTGPVLPEALAPSGARINLTLRRVTA